MVSSVTGLKGLYRSTRKATLLCPWLQPSLLALGNLHIRRARYLMRAGRQIPIGHALVSDSRTRGLDHNNLSGTSNNVTGFLFYLGRNASRDVGQWQFSRLVDSGTPAILPRGAWF